MTSTDLHTLYMRRALQLAVLGAGYVAPNPMVGAVLVFGGSIIAEGFHRRYGGAHAEVEAIKTAPKDTPWQECTLYVTLEPCNHYGKTPPCTELILEKGIKTVVVACTDPNPLVAGKGLQRLRDAGVHVITGICEAEALHLNRRFFTFHTQHRPHIILKWAESADGLTAPTEMVPTPISGAIANRWVHKWRSEEAAILVGTRTALIDNPRLTTRLWSGPDPLRILIDYNLKVPPHHHLLDGTVPTLVYNTHKDEASDMTQWVQVSREGGIAEILADAHKRGIQSILVEGGAALHQDLIDQGYADEIRRLRSKTLRLGMGLPAPILRDMSLTDTTDLGDDVWEGWKRAY